MTTNLQKGFTDELKIITARSALGAVAGENFETATMDRIGKNANFPLRMFATFPTPNPLLNFEASNLELGSGVGRSVPPIESVVPTVVASSINFQTGVTAGATFTVEGAIFALPTTTIGQYRRVAFVLNSSGAIDMKFSAANAVLASLDNPGALFDSLTGIPIGWIDLEATAATAYKTAGSATAIIENKVSGTSRINIFGQLVAASGSGKGTVDRVTQAAHTFSVGNLLYLNGATYTKGLATTAAASDVVGMVSRIVDANTFEITLSGEVTGLTGLTAGTTYFLSRSILGAASATEPNTLGDVSVPIGVASSTTSMYVAIKRGIVVGAANARSDIALANNTVTNVISLAAYSAGELKGWVSILGTTSYLFFVSAPFSKNGAGTDYSVSPQTVGDTPPVGYSMTITAAGLLQITLPTIPGYTDARIVYSLDAPAVGTIFPLSIDSTLVQFSTLKAKDSSGFALQNSGGTQIASLDNSGNFSVAGNGQGIVPLGAVIAMTTGITGSMAVPASGSASFGWQRADGVAIAGGSTLSGNTPNLSGSVFLRGATTYGGAGGGTASLIALNIPSISSTGTVTSAGTTVANNTGAGTNHSHGASGLNYPGSSVLGSVGGSDGTHTHTYTQFGNGNSGHATAPTGAGFASPDVGNGSTAAIASTTTGSGHGHAFSLNASAAGITGNTAGEAAHTHPIPSLAVNSGQTVSVTSTGTSGTAFNVIPNYIDVIYLIRVK